MIYQRWLGFFLMIAWGVFAQAQDTLRASGLTRQAEHLWEKNQKDSAAVAFEKAQKAWSEALKEKESEKRWERYGYAKNRWIRGLYLQKNYKQADSIQQLYLSQISQKLPKEHPELGYADLYRAKVLNKLGKSEAALPFYLSALQRLKEEGLIAQAQEALGYAYQEKGDYLTSSDHFGSALSIREKTPNRNLANCLYNLGWNYYRMSNYEQAVAYYLKALPHIKAHNPSFYPSCLNSIGTMYEGLGEVEKGLEYMQQALRIMREQLPLDHSSLAITLVNIGVLYKNLGDFSRAKAYYRQALPLLKAHQSPFLGSCLSNLSNVHYQLDEFEEALAFAKQALDFHVENLPPQAPELTRYYVGVAVKYAYGFQDSLQAEFYFKKALAQANASPSAIYWRMRCLFHLGEYHRYFNRPAQALGYFHQALAANLSTFDNPDSLSHPPLTAVPTIKDEYLKTLHEKAKILEMLAAGRMAYWLAADTCYQLCVQVIDDIRNSYREEESKLRLQEKYREIYEGAVGSGLRLFEKTKNQAYLYQAFSISEKARAVVLAEALKTSKARKFAGLPEAVLEEEKRLRRNLNQTEAALFSLENEPPPQDSAKLSELQAELFFQQQAYDSLLLNMEEAYPHYYQLKYQARQVEPPALQAHLAADQAFLSYVSGESHLYGFLLTRTQFIPFSQKTDSTIEQQIFDYYGRLKSPQGSQDLKRLGHRLYQFLLAPVGEWIEGKELIIATDGPLALIPFEVLIKRLPERGKAKPEKTAFLLHEHAISYVFSASTWFQQYEQGHASNQQVLAFAPAFNPLESPVPSRLNRDLSEEQDTLRGGIAELRGARQELELIRNQLEVKAFKGLEANEEAFKSLAPQYGILHLATHAMIDPEDALSSYLLLSPTEDSLEDNRLHAWELYNMQLQAQMAVLSACNTGSGELVKGEGVMSLGRAFAYAGVPSVVMSLWPVEDASTTKVMGYFYEGLAEGMAKDEALRQAKLRFLESAPPDARHPFYWAGFVVQGDASSLGKPGLSWQRKLLALLALLVISLIYWQIRKRKDD